MAEVFALWETLRQSPLPPSTLVIPRCRETLNSLPMAYILLKNWQYLLIEPSPRTVLNSWLAVVARKVLTGACLP